MIKRLKKHGAMPSGIPTFCVYEVDGRYLAYRPSSMTALASYDKEREVIVAARQTAAALHTDQVRVVFIVPTKPGE
jgi:hypothetical protein